MTTLIIKRCKVCTTTYYDGEKPLNLVPEQDIYIVQSTVFGCPHCPNDVEARPGFSYDFGPSRR